MTKNYKLAEFQHFLMQFRNYRYTYFITHVFEMREEHYSKKTALDHTQEHLLKELWTRAFNFKFSHAEMISEERLLFIAV